MHVNPIKPVALLMAVLLLVGCGHEARSTGGSTPPEPPPTASPEGAVKGMLALAEAGKWEEYVTTYYGEQHKMDKPETQVPELAAGLETVGAKLIETLRACAAENPKMAEDGTRAVYSNKFTLHRRDGKWGFHL